MREDAIVQTEETRRAKDYYNGKNILNENYVQCKCCQLATELAVLSLSLFKCACVHRGAGVFR